MKRGNLTKFLLCIKKDHNCRTVLYQGNNKLLLIMTSQINKDKITFSLKNVCCGLQGMVSGQQISIHELP